MECGEWVNGDLYTGRVVRVANSFVFKEPVFNYSGDFPFLWDEIIVPIKYGCDHNYSKKILEKVANELLSDYANKSEKAWKEMNNKFLLEPQSTNPMVTVVANDNWMEFTIRYIVDFKKRRTTKDKLFMKILDEIELSGGKIALASATFHIVEAPTINVKLN
jgi:small-conductance mechanosensitive channel